MTHNVKLFCTLLVAAIAGAVSHAALAADVNIRLSAHETYVGLPVTLQIQVTNAAKVDSPTIPNVDGLDIKSRGAPSRNTRITSINGATTTSITRTFAFDVTPQRNGSFQIPEITINVNGVSQHTRKLELVASTSETGDLMFVEIAGKQKEIYVGQALDLTLKIWLRPYNDRQLKITLSEGDMWRLISGQSDWGPFTDPLQQLAEKGQRPVGKEVLRKDRDGVEHSYYLYELNATIYPKRPGNIDSNNVKIVTDYPTALGRARDPFAGFFRDLPLPGSPAGASDDDGFSPFARQLVVQSVRPLVSQADVEPIEVLPIPTAGRPVDYRGAVGQYQIAIDASPTHVKAGDPINVLIGISGSGPMELVQAPPLADLPTLAADFKVPNEPLAGFVKGSQKIFSVAIRPRKAGVTEIPSIPFSYFDPARRQFATVRSAPVSIHVDAADVLALDDVMHNGQSTKQASNPSQADASDATASGFGVFDGGDVLVNQTPFALNLAWLLTFLAVPPLVVFVMFVLRGRRSLSLLTAWFGSASERFEKEVARSQSPVEIVNAFKKFVSRQSALKAETMTTEAVVGAMRAGGRRKSAVRGERFLNKCADEFAFSTTDGQARLRELRCEALEWLQEWQSEGRQRRPRPLAEGRKPSQSPRAKVVSQIRTATKVGMIALVAASLLTCGQVFAQKVDVPTTTATTQSTGLDLNEQQRKTLLAEATRCYNAARDKAKTDAAEAKQGFGDAAEKYQLLVGSGITNSRLYFNLANAYFQAGQPARAIANYRRCLRIDPTMREAQMNLSRAEQLLRSADTANTPRGDGSISADAAQFNSWLNQYISPRAILMIMVSAWLALWIVIGLRLFGTYAFWKTAAAAMILLFTLAASSSVVSWGHISNRFAIVIQSKPEASTQASAGDAEVSEGQAVELLRERGDAVQIRTAHGQTRWLSKDAVERI